MTSGMMLPPELSGLLNTLGFNWPESDEGKLFDLGGLWSGFADRLAPAAAEADGRAQQVLSTNSGAAVEGFKAFWTDGEAPKQNLDDGATASSLVGTGLYVCAGVVVALKIAFVVQLGMLAVQIAQAIATAVPTFGASLLEIPIFKEITSLLLDQAVDLAISQVLNA
ncbi:WXG100-like domain-containing protein [Saccharothrix coeruleofusca]|uniref:Outer membrane channel protein CpnT-like N-terminal domain-containing protein n=1 Tax=Saccharothrix coeruleofusca TaxID=33919 RepID=A0A918AL49_9PSEU|nr:hypothetical protein [Saccharothrix coeruleofusca]MBP2336602.1 hypothetical protein [Saccharothrix coeruleofusca]GGP51830.1 hypothetical protein GCM10010185_24860 [Saccharothrix coeruleofusca]